MGSRLELQSLLVSLLGSNHVYYQPPETLKMEYPAIKYSKEDIETRKAGNKNYIKNKKYTITVIDRMPDNPVIDKLLNLQYCSYDRQYKSDNLNHDVFTLYY